MFMNRFFIVVTLTTLLTGFNSAFAATGKPIVSIIAPTSGQHFTSDSFTIVAKASYSKPLAGVFYNLNGTGWLPMSPPIIGNIWTAPVSLEVGTNTLRVYAIGTNGVRSSTVSVKFFYDTVQKSLKGMTMTVNGSTIVSFDATTFSMDEFGFSGVGNYTYTKVSGISSKLKLSFTSPPPGTNKLTWNLVFDSSSFGTFHNGFDSFTLDSADSLAPQTLEGTLTLDDDSGVTMSIDIPESPLIVENPDAFHVKNPLVIWIDQPYPGEIGDLVSVKFDHEVANRDGGWTPLNTPTAFGTVIDMGTTSGGTNTVKVFFNITNSVPKNDLFAPISGTPVNIWSFTFTRTDGVSTNDGSGVFSYKRYSPIGALFALTTTNGTTDYDVFDFTDDEEGTFARKSKDFSGNFTTNSGTFSFVSSAPVINTNLAPATVVGNTLTMTNSSDFFEMIVFNASTFTETNSVSLTNSEGIYNYTRNSTNTATTKLTFTSGPTTGFTNMIFMTFSVTNFGTFVTTNFDTSGNFITNYSGNFKLQ